MRIVQGLSALGLCTVIVAGAPARGQQFSDWSAPINLGAAVNSSAGDFFPTISKDGLSLYFTSSRVVLGVSQGGWDIYVSRRATTSEPWGPPENLGPTINTQYNEGGPSLSIDGHRLYFASDRPLGEGGNDLYVARRRDNRHDFGERGWRTPVNLGAAVNTPANEASPAIVDDDTTGESILYFDSNREVTCEPSHCGPFTNDGNGNGNDIYTSVLLYDDTFDAAQLVAELSSGSFDRQPTIRRDGLEVFFASNRPGSAGLDLWVSTRAFTSDPWSTPVNLGPGVNSGPVVIGGISWPGTDAGPALSFDGTTLYFHSIRPGTNGGFDLYVVTRKKLRGQATDR